MTGTRVCDIGRTGTWKWLEGRTQEPWEGLVGSLVGKSQEKRKCIPDTVGNVSKGLVTGRSLTVRKSEWLAVCETGERHGSG